MAPNILITVNADLLFSNSELENTLENVWLLHGLRTQKFQVPVMKDQTLKMLCDSDVNF